MGNSYYNFNVWSNNIYNGGLSNGASIWIRDILHVTGYEDIKEIEFDIKEAPPLDRPILFIQGGRDRIIPEPKKQAEYIMD